ncbi:MAG: sugar ABC transporter [Candidatus Tectimicrobiota bacterium]
MIYTVELNFSDPTRVVEWNAWYETYLAQLVSLPGLSTAQRFRALTPGTQSWEYLALYSVASLDVFASEAYRSLGGGGLASRQFSAAIRRRRNVYTGITRLPEVTAQGCVVLTADTRHEGELADCLFVSLEAATGRRQAGATELDGEPSRRALAIMAAATAERMALRGSEEGLAVYLPISRRYVARSETQAGI